MPIPDLHRLLTQASQFLQRGDASAARRVLDQLAATHADHPDRLHLLALVCKAEGDLATAERHLRRALQRNPQAPGVLNNLGNLLRQLDRAAEAEQAYGRALALEPRHPDALKNLGLLLAAAGRDEDAVTVLEQALDVRGNDVAVWVTLGQCRRRLGDYEGSARCFQEALSRKPGHVNAIAGLGQTLRMMGRSDAAAACFDRAVELGGESVEVLLARADVTADRGNFDEAAARYRHVLALAPTHVGAHNQLSELMWQAGASDRYGESFAEAIRHHPDDPELLLAWCRGLTATGAGEQALQALQSRSGLVRRHPGLLVELGIHQAAREQLDAAAASFADALRLAPEDPQVNLQYARFAIYRGDYREALRALATVERAHPEDQLMWACRGLCWRLMGDDRAAWLNDDTRLIRTYRIDCPAGYGSLESFLDALAETLTAIHRTRAAPAHQSLRHGTQTAPRLFYRPEQVIQDLRQALSQAVARYIAALPDDPAHPMSRRRRRHFYFSGSWSVRLRSGGYHVNHVHPQGWISSSHYVTVPHDIGESAADPAGWLKFGESGLGLGEREAVSTLVRPEPGHVTLFPSYFWHGTVPFESDQFRLTTPFDVAPAR